MARDLNKPNSICHKQGQDGPKFACCSFTQYDNRNFTVACQNCSTNQNLDVYANFDFVRFSGGSCDNVFCGVGRECVEGLTKEPVCDCIERCYEPPSPICASDDVTYDNECEMHRAACSAGTVLRKIADGSCKKGILSISF